MKESHSKGNDECNVDKFWSTTKHVRKSHFVCLLPFERFPKRKQRRLHMSYGEDNNHPINTCECGDVWPKW